MVQIVFLCLALSFSPFVAPSSHVLRVEDAVRVRRQVTEKPVTLPKSEIYSFTVTSNIKYRYAVTTVSNRVANLADTAQEISFTVTLPDSAFISGFLMAIKDKVYHAYVKEKGEAKKDYQDAVSRGETAGHVEQSARDSNVFTVSVNVEPASKVTFNLTYDQLLQRTLGLYENVINVNPGQVVKNLKVEVNIEESSNITTLQVPDLKTNEEINEIEEVPKTNAQVKIERPSGNTAKIAWVPSAKDQNLTENGVKGQFIVKYDVDRVSNPNQILVDEGYFVHFYAPEDLKTLPKHVIFTLDVSGSMSGRKIEQLREALAYILSDIKPTDFFSLVLFSDSVQLWSLDGTVGSTSPGYSYYEVTTANPIVEIDQRFIISATPENINKAKEFAKTINDTGGTNIIAALRKSLEIATYGQTHNAIGVSPLLIFLTDGEPNVEMSDTNEITKAVVKQNEKKYPIYSLSLGQGSNLEFLRILSLSNNAFARNIYVASDTKIQLKNFYREISSPLLSNVKFEYLPGQVKNETVTQSTFNKYFYGSEMIVAGKLVEGADKVGGNLTGENFDGFFCIELPPPVGFPSSRKLNNETGHLEKLWAYMYIKELLNQDGVNAVIQPNNTNTLKEKALNISLAYSFVTPLTSLVVRKPNESESNTGVVKSPVAAEGMQSSLSSNNIRPLGVVLGNRFSPAYFNGGAFASYGYPGSLQQPMYLSAASYGPLQSPISVRSGIAHKTVQYSQHFILTTSARAPSYPAPPASSYSHPLITGAVDTVYEEVAIDSVEAQMTEIPIINLPLTLSDITWLNNSTEIKYPSSNNTYSVASADLPDTEFQFCLNPVDNSSAHCRHLAHCVLSEFIDSFESFLPYGEPCIIDARFVGVCCPKKNLSELKTTTNVTTDVTTEAASTAISTSTTA